MMIGNSNSEIERNNGRNNNNKGRMIMRMMKKGRNEKG